MVSSFLFIALHQHAPKQMAPLLAINLQDHLSLMSEQTYFIIWGEQLSVPQIYDHRVLRKQLKAMKSSQHNISQQHTVKA